MKKQQEKGKKAILDFQESHELILENVLGEYVFERKVKFDVNKKIIVLKDYYDVYRHKITKKWVAMPLL